jgi:hypothetical protein
MLVQQRRCVVLMQVAEHWREQVASLIVLALGVVCILNHLLVVSLGVASIGRVGRLAVVASLSLRNI